MPPKKPQALSPDVMAQFDEWYKVRRDQEKKEEALDQAIPKPVRDALSQLIGDAIDNRLSEIFGPEGESSGDDTSRRRPPGEGEASGGNFWGGLLGGKKASGED